MNFPSRRFLTTAAEAHLASLSNGKIRVFTGHEGAMPRKEWAFEYAAGKLVDAASTKMNFHRERLDWWKSKKKK